MTCQGCGTPITSAPRGRRRWCDHCKAERNRARAAAWAEAHPERRRAYLRDYYKANAGRLSAQHRAWAERNRERVIEIARRSYEANREQRIAAAAQWVREHPEAARRNRMTAKRNRRARKALAEGRHTQPEFVALCESFGWLCAYCGTGLDAETVTRDHVIPLARGGSDSIDNLLPACLDCNRRKGTRTLSEFLEMSL